MSTPLRVIRKSRRLSLWDVARATDTTAANLSRIERGLAGASRALSARLCEYFAGGITEMEILYPERYRGPRPVPQV